MKSKLVLEEETYKILGVCIDVHKKMGAGFEQDVYAEVLQREFAKHEIPFEKKKKLSLYYEGDPLQKYFIADFVCYDKIILDIKCLNHIPKEAQQQVVNYLKATEMQLALLSIHHSSAQFLTYRRSSGFFAI